MQRRRVQIKPGQLKPGPGYFHLWTQEAHEDCGAVYVRTLAIIEMTDGDIKLVEPTFFRFVK